MPNIDFNDKWIEEISGNNDRIHLVSLTKKQLDIVFFAITEDAVCEEYDEQEVLELVDLISGEMNTYE